MATGQREPSEASFPLPNRLFPQKVFSHEHERERSENGPWPPGDNGRLVDAHGVTGVMICHFHRAVRSDAVDLAGAPRSVALGQVGLTDGRAFALQDNHVCSMQTWLACPLES